jgi:FkbM family methyltransferase
MSNLISILRYIVRHPLASKKKLYAITRFFRWQFSQTLWKRPVPYILVEKSMLIVQKGMTGATGNIYTGLLEFEDMGFLLHVLREDDVFGDIGANVGVYSILASVNAGARTIALEPVPQTFSYLCRNISVNNANHKITALQAGVGNRQEELLFSSGLDTVNHVLTAEEKAANLPAVRVPVNTIDEFFKDDCPVLLKMDVEGFEWPALQGAGNIISNNMLKAIIVEINGSGSRYGTADDSIHDFLVKYSFSPYRYDPFSRSITALTQYGPYNTIYIRDIEWAKQRVASSRKYEVFGVLI